MANCVAVYLNWKIKVAKKMGLPRREVYFVGVHSRRTDHIQFHKEQTDQKPLKPSYFKHAFEEYRWTPKLFKTMQKFKFK